MSVVVRVALVVGTVALLLGIRRLNAKAFRARTEARPELARGLRVESVVADYILGVVVVVIVLAAIGAP